MDKRKGTPLPAVLDGNENEFTACRDGNRVKLKITYPGPIFPTSIEFTFTANEAMRLVEALQATMFTVGKVAK